MPDLGLESAGMPISQFDKVRVVGTDETDETSAARSAPRYADPTRPRADVPTDPRTTTYDIPAAEFDRQGA